VVVELVDIFVVLKVDSKVFLTVALRAYGLDVEMVGMMVY
jgi:hypothetical protein